MFIVLALVLHGGNAGAAEANVSGAADSSVVEWRPRTDDIPAELKPWTGWVLHGKEAWLCPDVEGKHQRDFCAWPGELKLEAREQGMLFTQAWEVQRESVAALPGNREYWPQRVTVDGKAYPVLADDGVPVVRLPAGKHTVSGWIPWTERPRSLAVPANVALISLVIDGKAVLPLERRDDSLTLGRASATRELAREEDSLDIQIYRKLSDGIPARLTTRLLFKVSGKARELTVANILPERFVPLRIASPWAARLEQDGSLQVQALPGQVQVEIEARLDGPLETVAPNLPEGREQEVWSYEAAPALRTTAILPRGDGKALAVDPRQSGVPQDWLMLPAFVVNDGAQLQIEERSRGQNERENQRLTLQREMWLDFSGEGFFARDRIEGSMRQGWRFDVAQPYTLERADSLAARADGANWGGRQLASNNLGGAEGMMAALLVTHGADERLSGVEWRQTQVTLNAGVSLAAGASARLPVTGWRQSFDRVDTTLHLPYGYRLIAAPGADSASANVWVERWTILDIFLAAFFTLLAWRLFGTAGGLAAAGYLALAMPEPVSPIHSFAAVVILALLRQAMPAGRLRKLFVFGERIALLCFVAAAVVFMPEQIRYALYPQLEESAHAAPMPSDKVDKQMAMAAAEPAPPPPPTPLRRSRRSVEPSSFELKESLSQSQSQSAFRQRYAQSTITQTGSGEPAWELGQQYRLHWSGPVVDTQSVRFLISPPWLTRLLRVAMLVLLGTLIWRLIRTAFPPGTSPRGEERADVAAPSPAIVPGVCLAILLAAALGFPHSAAAGDAFPSHELLEELQTRLLEAPECAPHCVDVAEARVDAGENLLKVLLTAHVQAATSLPLPEPDEHLGLRAVRVDGELRSVLRVDRQSYIALPRGIHHIQIDYAPGDAVASLDFPVPPARIEFSGTGWHVEGIDENRLLNGTLNFSRIVAEASPAARTAEGEGGETAQPGHAAQQFPPFIHVRRDLDLDLDWSTLTQVMRIAPEEGGFTFPVPLLPGEHVTTPEVKVQDGRALAVFASNASNTAWTARLDKTPTIELIAPPLSERAETWRVTVSPSWHLDWNGVPVTLADGHAEQVAFEFHPLPGEKLVLTLTQPVKTEGRVRAIDRVHLASQIGQHASEYTLDFTLRASQGGEHRVILPAELEVLDVRRDGVSLNLQPRENHLSLPVSPGTQAYSLKLRRQGDVGWITTSPAIDLGLPAANIDLRAFLTERRWILAASGPAVGPAILYWGELVAALIIAFLLARGGWTSLGRGQWFLLVLGFSTFSWLTLFYITLWLIVVDWRARRAESFAHWPALRFNTLQTGIVALTVFMLIQLVSAVSVGLLSVPDMGIRGYGSGANQLNWFADQSQALLPTATVFSAPIWVYRFVMLAWTLWLAYVLIRWLGRALRAWLGHGYWKKITWPWQKASPRNVQADGGRD
ncbi:MAG: hypothetical protein LBB76_01200 [Azoarcus sp.]|nr:hypothetical protein [Azoarcus sp.]